MYAYSSMSKKYTRQLLDTCTAAMDIIFPPTPEMLRVRAATPEELHARVAIRYENTWRALLPYADPLVRTCVHEVKFHMNKRAATLLGDVLAAYLSTQEYDVLIPVPLSRARRRERGYNQVELIAESAEATNVDRKSLRRTRNTRPQTELPKSERSTNVVDAFVCKRPERIEGAHILVLDDVVTTGATFKEVRKALRPHKPASITCVALAH